MVAALALGIVLTIVAGTSHSAGLEVVGIVLIVVAGFQFGGFFVVQPNESRVLILFGRYIGSVTEAGWWWCNPFAKKPKISLRVRNFQSERIKVNDASGNPIEIAAVVVWRITDTAKAVFDVADYEQFVTVQSETSLRHIANEYPYDDYKTDAVSLRGNVDEVRTTLQAELQSRLELAGIEILETRLTHLAYALRSPRSCSAASRPRRSSPPAGRWFRARSASCRWPSRNLPTQTSSSSTPSARRRWCRT